MTQKVSKNTINIKFVVAVMITVDNGRRPGNYSYADVMHRSHTCTYTYTNTHTHVQIHMINADCAFILVIQYRTKCVYVIENETCNHSEKNSLAFLDDCASTSVHMRGPYAIHMETLTIKLLIYFVRKLHEIFTLVDSLRNSIHRYSLRK